MTGNSQGPLHWAAELQETHGRFRLTNAQELVTPSNQSRDLQAWGPGGETQRTPNPQLSAKSRFETLGSRKPLIFWSQG